MHPNVSALVYVAARAPDAGEDYTALAKTFPTPPASAGLSSTAMKDVSARLHFCAISRAICRKRRRRPHAVQEPFRKALLAGKTTRGLRRSKPSFYAVSTEDRQSIRSRTLHGQAHGR